MYYVFDDTITSKEEALKIVKKDGLMLKKVVKTLQDDDEIVMAALAENPYAICSASERFKTNKKLILELMKKDKGIYMYIDDSLVNDDDIVNCFADVYAKEEAWRLLNFHLDPYYERQVDHFLHFSKELRDDKELALFAVSYETTALLYVSTRLKNDREVVCASVKRAGRSLRYANKKFSKDIEIGIIAISQNPYSAEYVDESIRDYCKEKATEFTKTKIL